MKIWYDQQPNEVAESIIAALKEAKVDVQFLAQKGGEGFEEYEIVIPSKVILKKPTLYSADVSSMVSITEAEREIGSVNQRNREIMQEWWKKLTFEQQCKLWKEDRDLVFYVSNPLN